MKYFVILLIFVGSAMLAPNAFGMCPSLPCEGGFVISDEHHDFVDFSYVHNIGEPIQFILEKTRNSDCNSYNAKITDKDGNFVWGGGADISCDPANKSNSVPVQTKIGYNEDHPIIINDSGKYYLEVEFDNIFIKREFVVRQNHGGANIDDTGYSNSQEFLSPLKQIKSGVTTDKIRCNEGLKLIYKHNQMPTCVKPESIPKLAERGWISETDDHSLLELKKVSDSCANDSPKERMANILRYSNGTHAFLNLGCDWKVIGVYLGD